LIEPEKKPETRPYREKFWTLKNGKKPYSPLGKLGAGEGERSDDLQEGLQNMGGGRCGTHAPRRAHNQLSR